MFVCRFMIVVIFKLQGFRDELRGERERERGRIKTTQPRGCLSRCVCVCVFVCVCLCVCVCVEFIYKLVNW